MPSAEHQPLEDSFEIPHLASRQECIMAADPNSSWTLLDSAMIDADTLLAESVESLSVDSALEEDDDGMSAEEQRMESVSAKLEELERDASVRCLLSALVDHFYRETRTQAETTVASLTQHDAPVAKALLACEASSKAKWGRLSLGLLLVMAAIVCIAPTCHRLQELQVQAPRVAESRVAESRVAESRVAESRVAQARVDESRVAKLELHEHDDDDDMIVAAIDDGIEAVSAMIEDGLRGAIKTIDDGLHSAILTLEVLERRMDDRFRDALSKIDAMDSDVSGARAKMKNTIKSKLDRGREKLVSLVNQTSSIGRLACSVGLGAVGLAVGVPYLPGITDNLLVAAAASALPFLKSNED